jgi:SAM-dependent methyltransferase
MHLHLANSNTSPVDYDLSENAWKTHPQFLQQLIRRHGVRRVGDIGGGANPVLSPEEIAELGVDYTLIDIDAGELDKAPACYKKLIGDVTSSDCGEENTFDLVFSTMLAEHVISGEALHRNLFRILAPGGLAFHFFPTLFSPPFVANYLLPERLASKLLDVFNPRDRVQKAKFPAHYSWCRGPTNGQLERLREIGYEVEMYRGFMGHTYYRKIPVVRTIAAQLAKFLVQHPHPSLTSFAWLLLRKPEGEKEPVG